MGVGDDDSRASDEEPRAGFVQPFQVNDSGLGLANKLFERKLGLKTGAAVGHFGGEFARESFGNRLQVHVKMIGLKEPVFASIPPVERNPVHGTFGELDFLAGVTDETDARHDRMLEARTHGSSRLAKIAAGKISFERRDAAATPSSSTVAPGGVLVIAVCRRTRSMDGKGKARPRKERFANGEPLADLAGTMNPSITYHTVN